MHRIQYQPAFDAVTRDACSKTWSSWVMVFVHYICTWYAIAQITPMSFRTTIPHRPTASEGHIPLEKTSNERHFQLNQNLSYRPNSSLKPTWNFLKIFFVLRMIFLTSLVKWKLALGPHGKDKTHFMNKTYIGNPKVNRGSPPLTVNPISAGSVEIPLDPQYTTYFTGGLPYWNFQRYAGSIVSVM